jgi:zinc and cadmium transporter
MTWWYYILLIGFPLAGGAIGYFANLGKRIRIKLVLAFAGAYLLSVVLFHLIPHIYSEASFISGVLLLSGFFFQIFLEKYSRGIEHGHLHIHTNSKTGKLIPYEILVSLSLHSFIEGMPLGSGLLTAEGGELSFLFGIVSHEMPAAFAMVSLLKGSHIKPHLLKWFIVIYASMSAMGAGLSSLMKHQVSEGAFEYLMAFVVGTFLHIATTILFENSEEHRFSTAKVFAIIGGIALAALVNI